MTALSHARRRLRSRVRRLRARSRLRAANQRRVAAALRRPVPAPPALDAPPPAVVSYGAPRTLLFVTVKRNNPSWRDLYGHWWVEVDGRESYGWWPDRVPLRWLDVARGTGGVLNGLGLIGRSGTWYRDSSHGADAAHAFHPVLTQVLTDDQVRQGLRAFAHGYRGGWRWGWAAGRGASTCKVFQDELLACVGVVDGPDRLHTRGAGCPFLYRPRLVLGWFADRRGALSSRRTVS